MWLALHGPIGSGKSTLAKALGRDHMVIGFGDLLKRKASLALAAEVYVTVRMMHENKERYRAFLQNYGDLIGFNDNPRFLREALWEWDKLGAPDCVFDCVRSVQQAEFLRAIGFKVVYLQGPSEVFERRTLSKERSHPVERRLPGHLIDLRVDASVPASLVELTVREYETLSGVSGASTQAG